MQDTISHESGTAREMCRSTCYSTSSSFLCLCQSHIPYKWTSTICTMFFFSLVPVHFHCLISRQNMASYAYTAGYTTYNNVHIYMQMWYGWMLSGSAATLSLYVRPLPAFQCCIRKARRHGITSIVTYVTVWRMVNGWLVTECEWANVSHPQSATAHRWWKWRL